MDKNICSNDDNVEPADAGRGEERVVISTDWLLWGGGDGDDGGGGDDGGDGGDDGGDVMWCWKIKTLITRTILLKGVRSAAILPEGPPCQPSRDDHSSKI